ncbi:hypothetical protein HanPI659440_Chr15g0602631 [Helianthus annuus]|nr:hypothetical protein HanPI659440_Chr15g0602631 [Helianthus annuus]
MTRAIYLIIYLAQCICQLQTILLYDVNGLIYFHSILKYNRIYKSVSVLSYNDFSLSYITY